MYRLNKWSEALNEVGDVVDLQSLEAYCSNGPEVKEKAIRKEFSVVVEFSVLIVPEM
jgi:hypothetical protein